MTVAERVLGGRVEDVPRWTVLSTISSVIDRSRCPFDNGPLTVERVCEVCDTMWVGAGGRWLPIAPIRESTR